MGSCSELAAERAGVVAQLAALLVRDAPGGGHVDGGAAVKEAVRAERKARRRRGLGKGRK
jgi:hypothetical protein